MISWELFSLFSPQNYQAQLALNDSALFGRIFFLAEMNQISCGDCEVTFSLFSSSHKFQLNTITITRWPRQQKNNQSKQLKVKLCYFIVIYNEIFIIHHSLQLFNPQSVGTNYIFIIIISIMQGLCLFCRQNSLYKVTDSQQLKLLSEFLPWLQLQDAM